MAEARIAGARGRLHWRRPISSCIFGAPLIWSLLMNWMPFHITTTQCLLHAAATCCKQKGKFVYLSATPPLKLQQEVQRGLLPYAKVPARFHGHPLPVPVRISGSSVVKCLQQRRLPKELLSSLQISLKRGDKFLCS